MAGRSGGKIDDPDAVIIAFGVTGGREARHPGEAIGTKNHRHKQDQRDKRLPAADAEGRGKGQIQARHRQHGAGRSDP